MLFKLKDGSYLFGLINYTLAVFSYSPLLLLLFGSNFIFLEKSNFSQNVLIPCSSVMSLSQSGLAIISERSLEKKIYQSVQN